MSIITLRARAHIDLSQNIFTKDELKTIFVNNYASKHQINRLGSLNNNMGYQCFRNAGYYLLARAQGEVWDLIDTLPTKTWATMTYDEKDLYIYVQTFVELMDDEIINRVGKCTNITFYKGSAYGCNDSTTTHKRTNFLDNRLNQINAPIGNNNIRYNSLGLLKYTRTYTQNHGASSDGVISYFLNNLFKSVKTKTIDYPTLKTDNFDTLGFSSMSNYIIVKLRGQPITSTVFPDINTIKQKIYSSADPSKKYNLVGILYDCGNHQVSSVCYGANCLSTPPNHSFHDDANVLDEKLDAAKFAPGVNSKLNFNCRTGPKEIQYLLYELQDAVVSLKAKVIAALPPGILPTSPSYPQVHGGGINYHHKYLKYKQKYLSLKNKF